MNSQPSPLAALLAGFAFGASITIGLLAITDQLDGPGTKVCVHWDASTGECTQETTYGDLVEQARESAK